MELIGIFFIASGLLVLAGIAKTLRPDDTARALLLWVTRSTPRAPSLYVTRQTVRFGALVESAVGVCALAFPRPVTAVLVAVSYTAFLCVVLYAKRHGGPLSTCGCFGRPDTPATSLHVMLNCAFVAIAVAVALQPPRYTEITSLLVHQPWVGAPLLLVSGAGIWLTYLALSPLATLEAARRLAGRSAQGAPST